MGLCFRSCASSTSPCRSLPGGAAPGARARLSTFRSRRSGRRSPAAVRSMSARIRSRRRPYAISAGCATRKSRSPRCRRLSFPSWPNTSPRPAAGLGAARPHRRHRADLHPLLVDIKRRMPSTRIVNLYGPTEATVESTYFRVRDEEPRPGKTPIGRPQGNSRPTWSMARAATCLPPGAIGELWLGGEGVTRGYLGRPRLTAEKFVPDPFATLPGARAYRTGRPRPLAACGRARVPRPGRCPAQDPRLPHRAGRGRGDPRRPSGPPRGRGARPAAAGTAATSWSPTWRAKALEAGELRRFCLERMPEHQVPTVFVLLGSLPRTSAGKVDRRALPPFLDEGAAPAAGRHPAREGAGGDFPGRARPRRGSGPGRRLLPARRPFPPGHPAGRPAARPLGDRAAAARALPHAGPGRAGRGGRRAKGRPRLPGPARAPGGPFPPRPAGRDLRPAGLLLRL